MERIHEYLWKDWPDPALKLWRKFKDFMLRTFSDTLYKTVAAELREWRILPNVSLWSWDGKVRKHLFTLCHLWKIFSDNFRFIRWRQKVFSAPNTMSWFLIQLQACACNPSPHGLQTNRRIIAQRIIQRCTCLVSKLIWINCLKSDKVEQNNFWYIFFLRRSSKSTEH